MGEGSVGGSVGGLVGGQNSLDWPLKPTIVNEPKMSPDRSVFEHDVWNSTRCDPAPMMVQTVWASNLPPDGRSVNCWPTDTVAGDAIALMHEIEAVPETEPETTDLPSCVLLKMEPGRYRIANWLGRTLLPWQISAGVMTQLSFGGPGGGGGGGFGPGQLLVT